jgi:phospholipid transport system substrate-binding protein
MIDRPQDEDVELTYRLRKEGDTWKIVDIYQKGTVSELALRRSEYSAVLKRDGFEALLKTVDAKTADYASGKLTQ